MIRGSYPPGFLQPLTDAPRTFPEATPTLPVPSNDQTDALQAALATVDLLKEQLRTLVLPAPKAYDPVTCPHCLLRIKPVEPVELDGFRIDVDNRVFTFNGKKLHLTPCEFILVHLVMEARGRVASREYLWANSKGPGIEPDTEPKIIDVFLCKARKRIMAETGLQPLQTSWGRGYYWSLSTS